MSYEYPEYFLEIPDLDNVSLSLFIMVTKEYMKVSVRQYGRLIQIEHQSPAVCLQFIAWLFVYSPTNVK